MRERPCEIFRITRKKSHREIFRVEPDPVFTHRDPGTTVEAGDRMSNYFSLTRTLATVMGLVLAGAATAHAQSAETGQKVYTAQKCSICHSIAGTGNKKGPLDGIGAKLSADEIRQWITDAPAMTAKTKATRKPPMKAYTVPKDELDGLVAYLRSLQ